jgi:tetratricopeptide (TPR) repeat protein
MYCRIAIPIFLTSILTIAMVVIDDHIAHASPFMEWWCKNFPQTCPSPVPSGRTPGPTPLIVERLKRLRREAFLNPTANNYIRLGYTYGQVADFSLAEASFIKARELAISERDVEKQAIAQVGLAEVYTATNRSSEAISSFTQAQNLAQTSGNARLADQINLRTLEVRNQFRITPPQIQQNPSGLEVVPQLQVDPSRLQQNPR